MSDSLFSQSSSYHEYCFSNLKDNEAEKKERQTTPHLWNLNPDPQLTGMIVQMIKPGKKNYLVVAIKQLTISRQLETESCIRMYYFCKWN